MRKYFFSEVLDQNSHANYSRISCTLNDKNCEITKALEKIDFLSRERKVGPDLSLDPEDRTLSLSEILDKTILTTLTAGINMNLPDADIRKKISLSLKNAGVSDKQIKELYSHFSLPEKTDFHLGNNSHVLKALAIPNKKVFDMILQGEDEQQKLKVRNTVTVKQTPEYLALLYRDIHTAVSEDSNFDDLIEKFLNCKVDLTSMGDRLKSIHKNVTENVTLYQKMRKNPMTRSVSSYVHEGAFPEIRYSEKTLKTISKKITSETVGNLMDQEDLPGMAFQCFHCQAVCDDAQKKGSETGYDINDDFASVNVFRLAILKTVEEVDKHYSALHTKKKIHKYLLPCLRCIGEGRYETCFLCCLACAKSHYLYLHSSSDPFHNIGSDLESSFKKDPSVLDSVKYFFDVRCRLCAKLFANSAKRDLHESRICLARAISLSCFFGTRLDVSRPLASDFSSATVSRIELETATKQANLLTQKQISSEGPFFPSDENTTLNTPPPDGPKSMKTYLSNETADLVRLRKQKPAFSFTSAGGMEGNQTDDEIEGGSSGEDREKKKKKKVRKNIGKVMTKKKKDEDDEDEEEEDEEEEEEGKKKGGKEEEEPDVDEEREVRQDRKGKKGRVDEEDDFLSFEGKSSEFVESKTKTRLRKTPLKQRTSTRGKNPFILDEAFVSPSRKQDVSSSSSSEVSTVEAASGSEDCPVETMDKEEDSDETMQDLFKEFLKSNRGKTLATKLKKKTGLSSDSEISGVAKSKKKKVVKKK